MRLSSTTSTSTAAVVRGQILASRDAFWRASDFASLPTDAVDTCLARLADHGIVHRVRQGLYWRGKETSLGLTVPSTMQVAQALGGTVATGPADWSARHFLGLSNQVPRRDCFAVPVPPPVPIENSDLALHLVFKDRTRRSLRVEAKLGPAEVAFLEVLGEDEGGAPHEGDRLVSILEDGRVDAKKLVRASGTEPARVRSRLRDLLQRAGLPDLAARALGRP